MYSRFSLVYTTLRLRCLDLWDSDPRSFSSLFERPVWRDFAAALTSLTLCILSSECPPLTRWALCHGIPSNRVLLSQTVWMYSLDVALSGEEAANADT